MAKLTRQAVVNHLSRIYCNGLISEVVIEPDFSCNAKVEEGDFFLFAPPLSKKKIFPDPIGLPKLDLVLRAMIGYAVGDTIAPSLVQVDNGLDKGTDLTLMIENADIDEWAQRLTSADVPVNRSSKQATDNVMGALKNSVKAGQWCTITYETATNLLAAMATVASDTVQVTAHRKGLYFRIGDMFTKAKTRKYPLATEIRPDITFQMRSDYLAAVLKQIPEENGSGQARLSFSGPHPTIIGVEIEGYMYAIGSKSPGV